MSGSNKSPTSSQTSYNLHYVSTKKLRNSPTSSILKTPTPIFLATRNSSVRTRRLKFANGPDAGDLVNDMREGSHDSASTASTGEISDGLKATYDNSVFEEKFVEVSLSPEKKMKVSPESWNAFLEYQKYADHSNETEKTDYTYSRLSKFRDKEIIPGFRIRPNLSRKPIHHFSSNESWSSSSAPETYFVKRSVYECNSSPPRKYVADTTTFERNSLSQNEISEYGKQDGYSHEDMLGYSDKYHSFGGFEHDTGKVLRSRKIYTFNNTNLDKQTHLGTSWGFDETDDEFTTSTSREEKPYSSKSKIIAFLTAIFAPFVYGFTSTVTLFKDLFSRYILRRNTLPTPYRYNYTAVVRRPWSQSGTSYGKYVANNGGRFSNWWYQSFLYALYGKTMCTITESIDYVRSKYHQSSRRGRMLWFLIPLLFLLAIWLMRAEGENAYVSNRITALKCKANQYFAPGRSHVHSMWKKISNYGEKIFGQSLEPFRFLFSWLLSVITALLEWAISLITSLGRGIFLIFDHMREIISHIWMIFSNFVSEAVAKKNIISSAVYDLFSGMILTVLSGLTFILGSVGSLVLNTFEYFKTLIASPLPGTGEMEFQSLKLDYPQEDLSSHWQELRKRIEALEIELRNVKEEKKAGTALYQKQLEDNYKALQKYQVIVNEALRKQVSKPVPLSKTSVQYYLDNATDELKKWILAHFMLKTDSVDIDEDKFALLMAKYSNKSGAELKALQDEFSRFADQYSAELNSLKTNLNVAHYHDINGNDMFLSLIKKFVTDEIKLHDADKTGKVDFALQSAGGQVLGVKCTKNFNHCFKYNNIFGLNVCAQSRKNVPELAINPGMAPGQCWSFAGSQGFLIIELSHSIIVTGFTMEHISRMVSPNGRIESAPKRFSMWGLKTELDLDPYLFGDYEYKDNNETCQYFPVVNYSTQPYKIVELSIASNHGNPNYTCLYRIRVHGEIYPSHL